MFSVARRAFVGAAVALAFGIGGVSVISAAWADPPGGGPPGKARGRGADAGVREGHFQDRDRVVVREYFGQVAQQGRCPPGLAKKGNGCLPPGQAKRWAIGAPLPRDLVYYSLPPELVVQLTPPPAGYRYVRVASDILMIAAGTGLVAAAIEDLGR